MGKESSRTPRQWSHAIMVSRDCLPDDERKWRLSEWTFSGGNWPTFTCPRRWASEQTPQAITSDTTKCLNAEAQCPRMIGLGTSDDGLWSTATTREADGERLI